MDVQSSQVFKKKRVALEHTTNSAGAKVNWPDPFDCPPEMQAEADCTTTEEDKEVSFLETIFIELSQTWIEKNGIQILQTLLDKEIEKKTPKRQQLKESSGIKLMGTNTNKK